MTERVGTSPSKPVWLRGAGVHAGADASRPWGAGLGAGTTQLALRTRLGSPAAGGRVDAFGPWSRSGSTGHARDGTDAECACEKPRLPRDSTCATCGSARRSGRRQTSALRAPVGAWPQPGDTPRLGCGGGRGGAPGSHRTAHWPCVRYAPRGSYFQGSDENEVAGSYVGPWNSTRCQREHLSGRTWLANLLPGASRSRWWACPCRIRRGSCHQPQGSQ